MATNTQNHLVKALNIQLSHYAGFQLQEACLRSDEYRAGLPPRSFFNATVWAAKQHIFFGEEVTAAFEQVRCSRPDCS